MKNYKKNKTIVRLKAVTGLKPKKEESSTDKTHDGVIKKALEFSLMNYASMQEIKKRLSEAIKKTLEKSDIWITRKELAKMAGISETSLYNALKGESSIDTLYKVAKVLNIEIDVK